MRIISVEQAIKLSLRQLPRRLRTIVLNGVALFSWFAAPVNFLAQIADIRLVISFWQNLLARAASLETLLQSLADWLAPLLLWWRTALSSLGRWASGLLDIPVPLFVAQSLFMVLISVPAAARYVFLRNVRLSQRQRLAQLLRDSSKARFTLALQLPSWRATRAGQAATQTAPGAPPPTDVSALGHSGADALRERLRYIHLGIILRQRVRSMGDFDPLWTLGVPDEVLLRIPKEELPRWASRVGEWAAQPLLAEASDPLRYFHLQTAYRLADMGHFTEPAPSTNDLPVLEKMIGACTELAKADKGLEHARALLILTSSLTVIGLVLVALDAANA